MKNPILFGFLFFLVAALSLTAEESRPNILFIISDDMGYSDIGCYGGEIETPTLDSMAQNGLRFTNYYVHNMCWPTRASILTGLYPKTALMSGSAKDGMRTETVKLPQALKKVGYTTLMSGKWHLSNSQDPDGPNAPHHSGFDQFYGTIDGASDFFAPKGLQLNGKDREQEWQDNPDFYYTDAITDYALKFLKDAPEESPFFLYLSYNAAHWPLHAKPEGIESYKGRYAMGWDELRQQRHARMKEMGLVNADWSLSPRHLDVPAWSDDKHQAWQERRMEVYAAQVTSMDRNIGRVVNYLETTGQLKNTIVIYQQDNGGCHVEYGEKRVGSWTREFTTDGKKTPIRPGNVPDLMPGPQSTFQSYGYGWANASNTPFRQFKQHDHEGGTRSPLIVSWPAGQEANQAGKLNSEICHVVDIMPTLLDFAGAEPPEQKPLPLEGRSFASLIQAEKAELKPRGPLFWNHNKGKAVRIGDWKLVAVSKGDWELYNLAEDGTELNDLSDSMPERVAELEKAFKAWDKRTDLGQKKK